jgi:hypothetical protein
LDHAFIAISQRKLSKPRLSTSGRVQLHVTEMGECATEVEVRGRPTGGRFLVDAWRSGELFDDHECDIATTNRSGS